MPRELNKKATMLKGKYERYDPRSSPRMKVNV
jgi:hypothetical protein